jgi:glycosyltransferase involved in cell wall biosynthesis
MVSGGQVSGGHLMATIRILHLLNTLSDLSLNRLVLSLVRGLDGGRYELHVGCLFGGGPFADEMSRAGARVFNFEMKGYRDLGVVGRLCRYVRCNDVQIVHTHILRADLVGWLSVGLARGCRLIATKHNLGYVPGEKRHVLRNALYYVSLYMPDLVISVSESMRQRLIGLPGLSEERFVTVHSGIDADHYFAPEARDACRRELGIRDGIHMIGYVGRLTVGKGLETLIQSMPAILQRHPGTRLLLAGEGALRDALERLAHDTGVASRVTFTGFRADVPRLLAAMDVYAQPSANEGLPLSILEAMAAGKPIVATRVGGMVEQIEHEVTGLLVPLDSREALAQAILRLLEDKHLAERVGRQARSRVIECFGLQRMVKAYDALYRRYVE